MISFERDNDRFNYRIVGIALHNDQVLLHQTDGEDFWTFPGGRAEFGEPAEITLKREMREELGVEIEVVRLLWFVENFFGYAGMNYHEVALYFLMQFPSASKFLTELGPYQGWEQSAALRFQWFSIQPETLTALPLLPSFLQTSLQQLPTAVQHVVHYDK